VDDYVEVFVHIGFLCGVRFTGGGGCPGIISMDKPRPGMAQEIARAAEAFEQERTGHMPQSVTVVS
jgi:hypothetical protein